MSAGCTYWANSILSTDTCAALESFYGITVAQLVSWDPAVKPTTTKATNATTKTTSTSKLTTTTATAASGPSPAQAGLIPACNAFYFVQSGDYCAGITSTYGNFTLDQFYSWNRAVKNDCTGLQAGYYVCVGVTGSTTVTTTTSKTTTAPATTTTSPYSPQRSGIVSTCKSYYFVGSGDTCAVIAAEYGISLSNFYSWNPVVGSTCGGLQAGYWVCVGISTTTTTITKTTTSAASTSTATGPSPTQAGIAPNCATYYRAVSGDSCWSIVNEKYTYLTTDKFYSWNPAVGSTCSNLQVGYYYCVTTASEAPMPNTISTCKAWHHVYLVIAAGRLNSNIQSLRLSLALGIRLWGLPAHLCGWVITSVLVFELEWSNLHRVAHRGINFH
ncbi:unnamed protein product [Penicillium egyptiacum]|uniref:LysM domain-containing protein n=1 Tax=Penicillium egyptiacum TaxID=1303716 RepID=A0A9W4KJ95_9EURO|nr:unnamed protein product [Penicillium egyptiacum]